MDAAKHELFVQSVEIRILSAVLARVSARSIEERISELTNSEISGLQYGILRMLGHHSSTLSELSRQFLLDPSTLVPVVHALERKSLVKRGRDPNDRRRWLISVTDEGKELVCSLPLVHEDDLLYRCLRDMGAEKTQELLNLLRDVIHRMPDGDEMITETQARMSRLAGEGAARDHPGCAATPDPEPDEQREETNRSLK